MWNITEESAASLTDQSQTYTGRADLLDPAGNIIMGLDAVAGDVTVDATAKVRRTVNGLTLVDRTGALVPKVAGDLLDPRTGNMLRIWRGIVAPSGIIEEVPLGTFRLTNPSLSEDDGGVQIKVDGYDISRQVQRAVWTQGYVVVSARLDNAIIAMLQDRWPGFPTLVTAPISQMISRRWYGFEDSSSGDPWDDVLDLAAIGGWQVAVNQMGIAEIGPVPDPATTPVSWRFEEGKDCTVTQYNRDLSEDETYSGVILTSDSAVEGTNFVGTAWDTDPNSPTYYLGPFGKIPKKITQSGIATQGETDDAAKAELNKLTGLTDQVSITAAPMPALDADDVIITTRESLGITGQYVIQDVKHPLGEGLMSITCRTRRF